MIDAYAVILVGGLLITTRLHLLGTAVTFWLTLAAGVGVLAASGHCMTARWAFAPVCGFDYWRVIVTSPEVLIFLFFMITDPKTVPAGRVGRVVFGVLVAVASTLLMAPQTTSSGPRSPCSAGSSSCARARPLLDRLLPAPRIGGRRGRPVRHPAGDRAVAGGVLRPAARVGVVVAAVVAVGVGIVAAGVAGARHGRRPDRRRPRTASPTTSTRRRSRRSPSSRTSPTGTTRSPDRWPSEIVLDLAENLELENQALLRSDADDPDGRRPRRPARRDAGTARRGRRRPAATVVERYQIDDVNVTLLVPFGEQDGLSLGLESRGTVTDGDLRRRRGRSHERTTSPFATTFAVRQATGGRWLNVGVLPDDAPS